MTTAPHIVFVSSTTGGGSGRSQRELSRLLVDRGIDVTMLVDDGSGATWRRRLDEKLLDATVRFAHRGPSRLVTRVRSMVAGPVRSRTIDGVEHQVSIEPELHIDDILATGTDLVVGSSISRPTWRLVTATARRHGVPTALYLREASAIAHLERTGADLVLANSHSLVDEAESIGHVAHFLPSTVTVPVLDQPSTQAVALLVNPIETHGLRRVAALATARPDVPIVLQESWPLSGEQARAVADLTARFENVTLRRRVEDNAALFRDARVLLAPHDIDNRPRTVLEAQANAIPVIASDQPGIRELVGDTGVLLPPAAPDTAWVDAVTSLWDDEARRRSLAAAGKSHAGRAEIRPDTVADRFLAIAGTVAQLDRTRASARPSSVPQT
ncbi:MAG: glycosyltransferase family 4 protein [Acidimicrobiales bacterium]